MKRILLLSLIVLVAVLILPSCTGKSSPTVTPTPTIDHGKYTPAEAAAVVREYLLSRATCASATVYVSRLSLGASYSGAGQWYVGHFLLYENSGAVVPGDNSGTQILNVINNLNKKG